MTPATLTTAPDRKSVQETSYLYRLIPLFYIVLAISLAHRSVAVWYYYRSTFSPIYIPNSFTDGATMLWTAHGDSLLSGVGGDVVFSLLIALMLAVQIGGKWLRIAAIAGLILYLGANLEHIKYNFSHINLATAHNAMSMTFIKGQLTLSLVKAVVLLTVTCALTYALMHIQVLHRLGTILALPILVLPLLFAGTLSFNAPGWMQTHPLLPTISRSSVAANPRTFSNSALATTLPTQPSETGYNILLVYLESLSEKSLEVGDMDVLSRLSEQNISFSRYIGNQIITVNGLYSTLTGDFPYLLSQNLKWEEIKPTDEIALNAVPAQLSRAGYHTAFLQSAPLDYMDKGKILPRIGFSESYGRENWKSYYSIDGWGIDDLALFENTLAYVDGLDAQTPWFVSILTTGTHSPYNVPADFMPEVPPDRYRALAYLDVAIGKLVDGLRDRGLLKNTVVIITSDESREKSFEDPLQDQIMLNWLPLVILHPSGMQKRFDFFIGSHRFPEILSAVASAPDTEKLEALGHSKEPLIFGNSYSRQLFWFEPIEKTLFSCDTQAFTCGVFKDVTDPMTMKATAPAEVEYFPDLKRLISEHEAAN